MSEDRSTAAEPIAFPRLTPQEIEIVAEAGTLETFEDGDALFEVGDVDYDFFVVESGEVEIVETSGGEPVRVTIHEPREFTGDIDMLTGRPTFVTATARGRTRAYRVANDDLRRILQESPSLSDRLVEGFRARRELLEASEFRGVSVVGPSECTGTTRIREFLHKNHVPATWFDVDGEDGPRHPDEPGDDQTPVVLCPPDGRLVRPTLRELADCIGIRRRLPERPVDLVVVGAGPAGLAAAIYAASEGLETITVDALGPGGQAGSSSRIENFIGFPAGISGVELANRAYMQILKFGGSVAAPVCVTGLEAEDGGFRLSLDDGSSLTARSVILATGATYRHLPPEVTADFRGAGIYYSATSVEARMCLGGSVAVVGGGNSAGQAAMYLSECAERVTLVVRGPDLGSGMSQYLANRIEAAENVEVRLGTEVERVTGGQEVEAIDLRSEAGGTDRIACQALFVFIGAEPNTEGLPDSIERDARGFVKTGMLAQRSERWPLERDPCALETTLPGVMAAGDIRSGSTGRVAFAAGDGALAVSCVHQFRSSR